MKSLLPPTAFCILATALVLLSCKKDHSCPTCPVPADNQPFVCDVSNRSELQATFSEIGNLSEPRVPISAAIANKLVLAGGWKELVCGMDYRFASAVIDIYDTISRSWSTASLSIPRADMAVVANGGKLFFAGGVNSVAEGFGFRDRTYSEVDIYDAASNSWLVAQLGEAPNNIAAASVGTKVLFAGGRSSQTGFMPTNRVDIYDVATETWSSATLSTPRDDLTAVTLGNKVYFAGRQKVGHIVDVYDYATNKWSTSNLKYLNGVTGGVALDALYWVKEDQVEILNPATGAINRACLSFPFAHFATIRGGQVAFLGYKGADYGFNLYNPATSQWSLARVSQSLQNFSITSLGNTIYATGGLVEAPSGCVTYTNKVFAVNW